MTLTCFKAYDIRGKIGVDLDEGIAHRIAAAFARVTKAQSVVVGHDCRASSKDLHGAVIAGLQGQGVEVIDIGLAGTEEVYFATDHFGAGGGIEITASHNPIDYNGMKMVSEGSRPLSDGEFQSIRTMAESGEVPVVGTPGSVISRSARDAYADHVVGMVNLHGFKPLKVLVNAGNGVAGPAFDAIAEKLEAANVPLTFVRHNHIPDGSFPNGIPNPLLPENQPQTAEEVRRHGCDLGVAWDGDFDRCFFFDENGDFLAGEHVVGLLARAILERAPGETIVYDPRVVWSTLDVVERLGGTARPARTGHAFVKAVMREENAIYGGEMSAHHYFRDFMFCDSGMIPWLKVIELMSITGQPLSHLVAEMRQRFASSGERNFPVKNAEAIKAKVEADYVPLAKEVDRLDGLSLSFEEWRMNLRSSSTEPLLRLNVESKAGPELVEEKINELSALFARF